LTVGYSKHPIADQLATEGQRALSAMPPSPSPSMEMLRTMQVGPAAKLLGK
jgi:hypothetical protein